MNNSFHFDHKKAAQALNFFALQNGGEIEKLHALKLIFFADRYHLRKYGRPITNDQYWAMKFGPVASGVKDLFELESVSHDERHYVAALLKKGSKDYAVRSIAPVDAKVFSQTDLEALRFAWDNFGIRPRIVEKTHLYPEWKRHEAAIAGGNTRVPMDYFDFLDDPPSGVNPCHMLTAEEREDRRAQLKEMADVIALWR
jgi:uncharacterized phage-associated protein